MTVVEVLKEARSLLARGWIQGTLASRDAVGIYECDPGATDAVAWCMVGAIMRGARCNDAERGKLLDQAQGAVAAELGYDVSGRSACSVIAAWNDARGRQLSEVLDLMDRAIARAELRQFWNAAAADADRPSAPSACVMSTDGHAMSTYDHPCEPAGGYI